MTLLLPEHAHSLVIERMRKRAVQAPATSSVQTWLLWARITVESQHLYGNFHMRQKAMRQAVGQAVLEKSKRPERLDSQALCQPIKVYQPCQYTPSN